MPEDEKREEEVTEEPATVEKPVSEIYPWDREWFVRKGLPVRSVMPKEYFDEKKAEETTPT